MSYTKNAYQFNRNEFPHTLAKLFKEQGYSVNAFHMNDGEYYSRRANYKNWGYDEYYGLKEDEVFDVIIERIIEEYEKKLEIIPAEIVRDFEKHISLRVIDEAWVKHIADMDHLREGIGLRGYGQNNPLQAYAMEGYEMFERMQDNIDASVSTFLCKMEIKQNFTAKPMEGQANDGKEKLKSEPVKNEKKVGRNDPCPCGSGKKYKQCHGKTEA